MTSPGHQAVLARPRGVPAAGPPGAGRRAFDGGPVWMRVAPSVVTLAVVLWGITGSSYWRDESATVVAVDRPLGGLVRMLGHVDAVHGAYYLIMWPLVRVAGTGEFATRLPSALAMAAAAALVGALGRRLVSPSAGLAAGLVFAVLPIVSLYGQDARSYAMVTAFGAAASYLLVRLIAAPGSRRGWLAGYAACLAVMGLLNIFGLLLAAAHGITVAVACLRERSSRARLALALGWLAAAAGAVAVVSPVVLLAWTERGQLAWLTPPGPSSIVSLEQLAGAGRMAVALGAVIGAGLLASALTGRAALRAGWPVLLSALAVPWLLVPPALLLEASRITPLYTLRYVLFCVPAGALLAGTGLAAACRAVATGLGWTRGGGLGESVGARLPWTPGTWPARRSVTRPGRAARLRLAGSGWAAGAAALAVIALLGLGAQAGDRSPAGHGDNIRQADRIVAVHMRPGDAVLYDTPADENLQAAYPYGMVRLTDVAQYQSPVKSATVAGTTLPVAVVRQRITNVSRLWVIEIHHPVRLPVLQGLGLRLAGIWHPADLWLFLYAQRGA
jgi:mannosyltransferase